MYVLVITIWRVIVLIRNFFLFFHKTLCVYFFPCGSTISSSEKRSLFQPTWLWISYPMLVKAYKHADMHATYIYLLSRQLPLFSVCLWRLWDSTVSSTTEFVYKPNLILHLIVSALKWIYAEINIFYSLKYMKFILVHTILK